jgi:hypothetical protein
MGASRFDSGSSPAREARWTRGATPRRLHQNLLLNCPIWRVRCFLLSRPGSQALFSIWKELDDKIDEQIEEET